MAGRHRLMDATIGNLPKYHDKGNPELGRFCSLACSDSPRNSAREEDVGLLRSWGT